MVHLMQYKRYIQYYLVVGALVFTQNVPVLPGIQAAPTFNTFGAPPAPNFGLPPIEPPPNFGLPPPNYGPPPLNYGPPPLNYGPPPTNYGPPPPNLIPPQPNFVPPLQNFNPPSNFEAPSNFMPPPNFQPSPSFLPPQSLPLNFNNVPLSNYVPPPVPPQPNTTPSPPVPAANHGTKTNNYGAAIDTYAASVQPTAAEAVYVPPGLNTPGGYIEREFEAVGAPEVVQPSYSPQQVNNAPPPANYPPPLANHQVIYRQPIIRYVPVHVITQRVPVVRDPRILYQAQNKHLLDAYYERKRARSDAAGRNLVGAYMMNEYMFR